MAFNWIEFFKQEKDVYVQNVSGYRISMMFGGGTHGSAIAHSFEPSARPVCLTNYIPFDAIKNSAEFRKMVTRRPPHVIILSEDEYKSYYADAAKAAGMYVKDEKGKKVPDVERAIDKAEEERRAYASRQPLADAKPPQTADEDTPEALKAPEKVVMEEDLIHPKVVHLCNQVKNEIPENDKMPAQELIMELKGLSAVLKLDDWEYARAHGWYASVKKLAKQQIEKLAKDNKGAGPEDDEE